MQCRWATSPVDYKLLASHDSNAHSFYWIATWPYMVPESLVIAVPCSSVVVDGIAVAVEHTQGYDERPRSRTVECILR
jgi:hypothetical protein